MTWTRAFGRSLVIVAYFLVATVLLPGRITRLTVGATLRDILVLLAWAIALALGMWMLRSAQRRGVI